MPALSHSSADSSGDAQDVVIIPCAKEKAMQVVLIKSESGIAVRIGRVMTVLRSGGKGKPNHRGVL